MVPCAAPVPGGLPSVACPPLPLRWAVFIQRVRPPNYERLQLDTRLRRLRHLPLGARPRVENRAARCMVAGFYM